MTPNTCLNRGLRIWAFRLQVFARRKWSRRRESNSSRARTEGVLRHGATTAWWIRRESNSRHSACKADVLPLNYGPAVEMKGIEPLFRDCQSRVLPLDDIPVVESRGIEPRLLRCERNVLPLSLRPRGR